MKTVVVYEEEGPVARIRAALVGTGRDCPASSLVPIDRAREALRSIRPELVVLSIGSDPSAARSLLGDLRPMVAGSLVVVGGLSGPKSVVQILRAGADDYVDLADIEADLPAVVGSLGGGGRATEAQPGRSFAVLSPSGGGGASTIAANLAVLLAKEHGRSALVDLRLVSGDLASLLDLKPIHTLADLFPNVDRVDAHLFERTFTRHDNGVHLLASPRRYGFAYNVDTERFARVLDMARAAFPAVVVDIDPSLGPEQVRALREVEAVIVVLRLEFSSLCNARQAIEHLERCGIPKSRILPVANRQGQPREVPVAKAEEALNVKFAALIPDDPKVVIRSNNNGLPAVTESPSSWFSKGLAKLAAQLAARPAPRPRTEPLAHDPQPDSTPHPPTAGRLAPLLDGLERTLILVLFSWLVARVAGRMGEGNRVVDLLLLASEGLVLVFTLLQRRPSAITARPVDWTIALLATTAPLLVRPADGPGLAPAPVAVFLMMIGLFVQLGAKLELGRSFGCVAALRGIKRGGPYRFVRHPMYGGYLLGHLAFLLANPSARNALLYLLAYALQVPRLLTEERLLSADPEYRAYLGSVRYRLIPGLF